MPAAILDRRAEAQAPAALPGEDAESLMALSAPAEDGRRRIEFAVPDAHCASCISAIETELCRLPQVESARVNLTERRVKVVFAPERGSVAALPGAIRRSGYRTHVLDPDAEGQKDATLAELTRGMAVSGFAAGNIMLFSISVWAGADAATRDLFHWISALIALPAIVYAGRPFFRSALAALRAGRTNMDVPISIGIVLATGLSLYETLVSGEHAYFDASTMLLFFLLIGRTLDHLMRVRARGAIANLARLMPRGAQQVLADGTLKFLALGDIAPGMMLMLRAGDRAPVDCRIVSGEGDFDFSVVTGESLPRPGVGGMEIAAGAISLSGGIVVEALRPAGESFLTRMTALMEAAEATRTSYRRLADRVSEIYAPVVHGAALLTFIGWGLASGDWHAALLNAVAVLIITCPCALALAVPIVHAVAAGRLFQNGIMVRDGTGLERAARVKRVAFDKTGTLTEGAMRMTGQAFGPDWALARAAGMALHSQHALARALVAAAPEAVPLAGKVREVSGQGLEVIAEDGVWRLGNAWFCGHAAADAGSSTRSWLAHDGIVVAAFDFADTLRADATEAVAALRAAGLATEILSGDVPGAVAAVAREAGIADFRAQLSPEDKLSALASEPGGVMMVGDGINDAPALRAADVSMAPSSASDIGRSAADFVFTNGRLMSVPFLIDVARRADRLVVQNLVIALVYNALALPLAVTGHVTPLIAAIAMSASSVIVVGNAMRLNLGADLSDTGRSSGRVIRGEIGA